MFNNVENLAEELSQELVKSSNTDEEYLYQKIDTSGIEKCHYDMDAFYSGIKVMSELAGKITALTNVGIPASEALEYICTTESNATTYKLQTEIAKYNNDTNVKIANITGEATFKQQV